MEKSIKVRIENWESSRDDDVKLGTLSANCALKRGLSKENDRSTSLKRTCLDNCKKQKISKVNLCERFFSVKRIPQYVFPRKHEKSYTITTPKFHPKYAEWHPPSSNDLIKISDKWWGFNPIGERAVSFTRFRTSSKKNIHYHFPMRPADVCTLNNIDRKICILSVDVETHDWINGKRIFGYARMVELSWCVFNEEGILLKRNKHYISDCPTISEKASQYHKIKDEILRSNGIPVATALQNFISDVKQCQLEGGRVVAHKLEFDMGIIDSEIQRLCRDDWGEILWNVKKNCTMAMCTNIKWRTIDLKRAYKRWVDPSSSENAINGFDHHNAAHDAEVCGRIWFAARRI